MANALPGKALSDIEIEESLAKKALDRSMFSRLLPLLGPVRGRIGAVIVLELLLVFAVFLRPWFVRELLDRGLVHQDNQWLLNTSLVAMLGVGLNHWLSPEEMGEWGWRIPFLLSIVLLGISTWIRMSMQESPAFVKMKAEGKTSKSPIRESFGKWENLKIVLIALLDRKSVV